MKQAQGDRRELYLLDARASGLRKPTVLSFDLYFTVLYSVLRNACREYHHGATQGPKSSWRNTFRLAGWDAFSWRNCAMVLDFRRQACKDRLNQWFASHLSGTVLGCACDVRAMCI